MHPSKFAYTKLHKVLLCLNDMGLEESPIAEDLRQVMDQLTGWVTPSMKLGPSICPACRNDNTNYHADNWAG